MATQPPAAGPIYELALSTEVHVTSFRGAEIMNGLYSFEIDAWFTGTDEGTFETGTLGQRATLTMHLPDGTSRLVHGVVSALVFGGLEDKDRRVVTLTVVPAMARLEKRVNSRIFQDMTVDRIVDAILQEHGIVHVWNLHADRAPRAYCVQYQESDLRFVSRVLALEGIFFLFEQPATMPDGSTPVERLVLADTADDYDDLDGDPGLLFRPDSGVMAQEENHVLALRARAQIESDAVTIRDYDYQRPALDLAFRADGYRRRARASRPRIPTSPSA